MSCWGSRHTNLFTFRVHHQISWDDDSYSDGRDRFTPRTHLEIRVWKWELLARFERGNPSWYRSFRKHGHSRSGTVYVPRIGCFDLETYAYPAHQFDGDYSEHIEARRKGHD